MYKFENIKVVASMRFENLQILYLCNKDEYLHRTSRVRFHAVEAMSQLCNVVWSGPGWENWSQQLTLDENIDLLYPGSKKPDMILCYKPQYIKGFAKTRFPTSLTYNEMDTPRHPLDYTIREVVDNRVDLVVCHHRNEMEYPAFRVLSCDMVNISHCANDSIFKDYQLVKEWDVLLVGNMNPERYPLRNRLRKLLLNLQETPKFSEFKMDVLQHPGNMAAGGDVNSEVKAFAQSLNRTRICLTCSGIYRCRYGKYTEIPACRSLLMADLPGEGHEFFRQFMAVIEDEDSDEVIANKLHYYLTHNDIRRKMVDFGYHITHENYTQKHYARRYLQAVITYLKRHKGKKVDLGIF